MDAEKKQMCFYVRLRFLKSAPTACLPVETGNISASGKVKLEEWVKKEKKKKFFFLVLQQNNTKRSNKQKMGVNSVCFSFYRSVDLNDLKECLQKKPPHKFQSATDFPHSALWLQTIKIPPSFHQNNPAWSPECPVIFPTAAPLSSPRLPTSPLSWIRSETQSLSPSPCYQVSS